MEGSSLELLGQRVLKRTLEELLNKQRREEASRRAFKDISGDLKCSSSEVQMSRANESGSLLNVSCRIANRFFFAGRYTGLGQWPTGL